MDRRDFIKHSCVVCLGGTAVSTLLGSCGSVKYTSGRIGKDGVAVDVADFFQKEKGKYRSYVVVRNESLLFPICIYRFNETEYSAIWMECAHQGAELNVVGDYLQCPAHGSEYNNHGEVTNGPAEVNLRTFPVIVNKDELFIDLRKQQQAIE